jgi:hypothetical protein
MVTAGPLEDISRLVLYEGHLTYLAPIHSPTLYKKEDEGNGVDGLNP